MTTEMPTKKPPRRVLLIVVFAVIGLAGGLLFFGRSGQITVPLFVEFGGMPEGLLVVGHIPVMEARITGPSGLVRNLKDTKLRHSILLTSAKPGELHLKISPDMIKAPQGTSVLEVHPTSFFVRLDNRVEKVVPVVADLQNEPVAGYEVSAVTPSPSRIRLAGPASILEEITAVRTTPVDLTGLTESIQKRVALNLNHSPHVQPVDQSLIEIEVEVKEKVVEVSLSAHVKGTGTDYRCVIRPDKIELVLRGPENTLKDVVQGNGLRIHVDLHGLEPGTYLRRAVIEPPLNTSLVEAEPEEFTVEISESAAP
jgi:YbbR domain-containing protein